MKQAVPICAFCKRSRYRLFWHRYISSYEIIIKRGIINNERLLSREGDIYFICSECIKKRFNFKLMFLPITTKIYNFKKDKYVR